MPLDKESLSRPCHVSDAWLVDDYPVRVSARTERPCRTYSATEGGACSGDETSSQPSRAPERAACPWTGPYPWCLPVSPESATRPFRGLTRAHRVTPGAPRAPVGDSRGLTG